MNTLAPRRDIVRERLGNAGAVLALLVLAGLALFGPAGVLAWGEDSTRLNQYEHRLAELRDRKTELENRVQLLDPDNVDPDLASELVRRDLNVAHPDEYIMELEATP